MGEQKQENSGPGGSRRVFFKAALGIGAGVGVMAGAAPGATIRNPVSWVHGNSATVVDANGLERDRVEGNARVVHGRSWSTVPLHFAVPSPMLDIGEPIRVSAVWLRVKAGQGARISAMILHDCELTLTRLSDLEIRRDDWDDVRIALDPPCAVSRSLGLTVECTFADVARQMGISAIGCEFVITA